MDRRLFFRTMIGGVAASSAVRTWPFRVFSFPTELRIFSMEELRRIYLERAMAEISRGGGAVEGVQSGAMKGTRRNFSGNPVYQELA